jgi:hypothetical protein
VVVLNWERVPKRGAGNNPETKKEHSHVNLNESSLMAYEANAKNLVLTHFVMTHVDTIATANEFKKNYPGKIIFAKDLMVIPSLITSGTNETALSTRQQSDENTTKPSFKDILTRMDANKDGKIDESEAKGKLKENFSRRDKNKDGFFTEDEFQVKN